MFFVLRHTKSESGFLYQKSLKRTERVQNHYSNFCSRVVNSQRLSCTQKSGMKCSYESFLLLQRLFYSGKTNIEYWYDISNKLRATAKYLVTDDPSIQTFYILNKYTKWTIVILYLVFCIYCVSSKIWIINSFIFYYVVYRAVGKKILQINYLNIAWGKNEKLK